jgi:hypothetical protein
LCVLSSSCSAEGRGLGFCAYSKKPLDPAARGGIFCCHLRNYDMVK